jgi:hypothetical protein
VLEDLVALVLEVELSELVLEALVVFVVPAAAVVDVRAEWWCLAA